MARALACRGDTLSPPANAHSRRDASCCLRVSLIKRRAGPRCGGGGFGAALASAMEANRGMVAGSRGGVVTIRHDGDGAAVRSFFFSLSLPPLRCSARALPPLCSVAFRYARAGPSICRAAVRRRADCLGSASDSPPVRLFCGVPRFCSA